MVSVHSHTRSYIILSPYPYYYYYHYYYYYCHIPQVFGLWVGCAVYRGLKTQGDTHKERHFEEDEVSTDIILYKYNKMLERSCSSSSSSMRRRRSSSIAHSPSYRHT